MKEIRTKIRGVTFDDPVNNIPRQKIIRRFIRPGTKLLARLEPNNPADAEAVAVWLKKRAFVFWAVEYHLGYLVHSVAQDVRKQILNDKPVHITVLNVTGGSKDKPTRGVNVIIRY